MLGIEPRSTLADVYNRWSVGNKCIIRSSGEECDSLLASSCCVVCSDPLLSIYILCLLYLSFWKTLILMARYVNTACVRVQIPQDVRVCVCVVGESVRHMSATR